MHQENIIDQKYFRKLFNFDKPITVYTDNTASLENIKNDEINTKLKHIESNISLIKII